MLYGICVKRKDYRREGAFRVKYIQIWVCQDNSIFLIYGQEHLTFFNIILCKILSNFVVYNRNIMLRK